MSNGSKDKIKCVYLTIKLSIIIVIIKFMRNCRIMKSLNSIHCFIIQNYVYINQKLNKPIFIVSKCIYTHIFFSTTYFHNFLSLFGYNIIIVFSLVVILKIIFTFYVNIIIVTGSSYIMYNNNYYNISLYDNIITTMCVLY